MGEHRRLVHLEHAWVICMLHQAEAPTLSLVHLLDHKPIKHEKSLTLLTFTLKTDAEFVS